MTADKGNDPPRVRSNLTPDDLEIVSVGAVWELGAGTRSR